MADKRPTKSQAELAVALLRCYIQQPDSADTYTSAMQLLADIDTRKRAHLKRSPRWVTDHSGQHFRTGDTVTTTSGQRLQVHAVDTLAQTCLLDDGSAQDGKTLTKINPKSRTTSAVSTTQTSLALEDAFIHAVNLTLIAEQVIEDYNKSVNVKKEGGAA